MSSGSDLPPANSSSFGTTRPEELPPVTPPSAGYIVQLFLIPALIVMAVVAVWALFGKLADSESDWQQLVAELGSSNDHRRWRAALGLAQLLRNEEIAPPTDREPLAQHPLVIESLTGLLSKSLSSTAPTDEDITHQEFLARTMGALDADEATLPVLAEAMNDSRSIEVRKSALMSVATIAGRKFDKATGYAPASGVSPEPTDASGRTPLINPTISDPAVLEQLKRSAQSPEPVIRHLAAFALANVGGPDSIAQLKVMLLDGDRFARANAAVGLARNGSTDCVPTLIELLSESLKPFEPASGERGADAEQRLAKSNYEVEQPQVVRNCLRAVGDLWPQLSESQRNELRTLIEKVADEFFAPDIRIQASELLKATSRSR